MRILFVEDIPSVLEETREFLRRAFPSAEIETATNGKEAREKIDRASRTGRGFDVAVLDLSIPADLEAPAELDLELCEYARQAFPDGVFLRYSGYASVPKVQQSAARSIGYDRIVDKLKDGPRTLIETIRQGYGDKLAARTRAALGGPAAGLGAGSRADRMVRGGQVACGTAEVNALLGEIREGFAALDERSQREIQRYVEIKKTPSGLQVIVGRQAKEGGGQNEPD